METCGQLKERIKRVIKYRNKITNYVLHVEIEKKHKKNCVDVNVSRLRKCCIDNSHVANTCDDDIFVAHYEVSADRTLTVMTSRNMLRHLNN